MKKLTALTAYRDELGNVIESPTRFKTNIMITIRGQNNRVVVDKDARIQRLAVVFDCDNGTLFIGPNSKHGFNMFIRIGQDSTVRIGADVTTTSKCNVSAVEGTTITIGDDVMFASDNHVRSDDSHPIFDITSGKRVNPSRDVTIGNHAGRLQSRLAGSDAG